MKTRLFAVAAAFNLGLFTLAQAAGSPPASEGYRAAAAKPVGYRSAKYTGGEGATWRTGRDSHGFQGSYGGCQYRGHAGPNGYTLDRVC